MVIRKSFLLAALAAIAMVALTATTFAATTYEGGASADDGVLTLVSNTADADADNDFGVARFDVPDGTTFADLMDLSAEYNVTDDGCFGGSPRFQIRVDTGDDLQNIFAYLGPQPNYTDCALNTWSESGDLLTSGRSIDTSQVGGTFYDTYENAVADYGSYPVVSVSLVVDGSWATGDGEQTVQFDEVMINDVTHDFSPDPDPEPSDRPTDKDQCKKGGWQDFSDPSFKNQGQCVSYTQHNK